MREKVKLFFVHWIDKWMQQLMIYLSHAASQKLAESLGEILERVHTQGDMETYPDKEDHKTKSR